MMEIQGEAINAPIQNESIEEMVTNGNVADEDDKMNENSSHEINGSHTDNNNDCLVRLVFRDNDTFDELHQVIGQCIRDALFSLKKRANLIVDKSENCVRINEISNENDENMFMVDTLPTDNANESEIPDYNSSALEINEDDDTLNETETDDGNKPKTGNCWNCGGDHTMKDCKEKRDPAAISRAKQSFMQKTKTERYHLDAEQKYSNLVPGQLSDNLRQALGLRSRELPLFIYKMRLYGYPQGWLEEAKINHSGLSLFHSENKNNDEKDDDNGDVDKVEYDASKFIEYPGFNAPIPSNVIDDGDYYRVPPMFFEHSKEGLIQSLQNNLKKTYKRKRLKLDATEVQPTENVKGDDMDIEASDDENTDSPVLFPQPRPVDESNSNTVPDEASLLELERRQEELRRALEDASSDSNSLPSDQNGQQQQQQQQQQTDDNEIAQPDLTETIQSKTNENTTIETDSPESPPGDEVVTEVSITETIAEITEMEESVQNMETILNTPTPSTAGHSRESVSGTPLIKQVSPFTRLPGGEKWSVGVSEVIDFENLPEATGTYQKLTGLIQKVRTVVKRINDDTENDSS